MTEDAAWTDPATEMYELAETLRYHHDSSNRPQHVVLADLLGTTEGSDDYFTLIAAVRRRIAEFEALVKASPKIRPRPRDGAIAALTNLAAVFSPRHSHDSWNQLTAQQITETHITALVGLEQYFADAHPLKRLSDADRQALIAEMDELLAVLAEGRLDLEPLLIDAVSRAFRDLRLVLEKFQFFGRRVVEEKLFIVASALHVAGGTAPKGASAATASFIQRAAKVVKTTANAIVFVGGLSGGVEAIGGGFGWVATQAIEQIGEVRLLTDQSQQPAPAAGDTAPVEEAVDATET